MKENRMQKSNIYKFLSGSESNTFVILSRRELWKTVYNIWMACSTAGIIFLPPNLSKKHRKLKRGNRGRRSLVFNETKSLVARSLGVYYSPREFRVSFSLTIFFWKSEICLLFLKFFSRCICEFYRIILV